MNTEAFLQAQLARPLTHDVVTTFACGRSRMHGVRSVGAAENYATGERRKIGKELIDRATGGKVLVVSVGILRRERQSGLPLDLGIA